MAAARAGFTADGVELNPWLVLYSRIAAYKAGVSNATSFYRKNLFKYSLKPYNNIVIFGVKEMVSYNCLFPYFKLKFKKILFLY